MRGLRWRRSADRRQPFGGIEKRRAPGTTSRRAPSAAVDAYAQPTSEGAAYYEHVAAHLRAIEEAEDIVQAPGNVRGVLRVTVPTTFGRPLISAWARSFLDRYPDIKLDLSVTDRRVDLIREGFDIAVQIGELEDTNLIGRSLGVLHHVLGASPKYLQRRGIPRSVDDLKQHACLRHLLAGRPQPFTFADGTRCVPMVLSIRKMLSI